MDHGSYNVPADAVQIIGAKSTPIAVERADGSAVDGYVVLSLEFIALGPSGSAGHTRPFHLSAANAQALREQLQRALAQLDRELRSADGQAPH